MSGGSPADGCSAISRIGTRTLGWMRPGAKTLREAGSESETTVSGTAFIGYAPRAVGPRKTQRSRRWKSGRKRTFLRQHELDQVRRVAMPRLAGANGLSAPCRGSPSFCWRDHSPRGCGGQDAHLGRKRIGKNCNREGNLCKTYPSEAPAARWPPALGPGSSGRRGRALRTSIRGGSRLRPLHGSPVRPCDRPRRRAPDSARSCASRPGHSARPYGRRWRQARDFARNCVSSLERSVRPFGPPPPRDADSARSSSSRPAPPYRPCWRSGAAARRSWKRIPDWTYGPPSCVRRDLIPEPSLLSSHKLGSWGSRATTAAAIDVRP